MLDIKNKIEFEGNCWIGEVKASLFNSSKENRIKAVTDMASITKGRLGYKEPWNKGEVLDLIDNPNNITTPRQALYNRLLTESGGNASTPFEFIPIKVKYTEIEKLFTRDDFNNDILKYSYTITDENHITWLLTNMRTLLKTGIKEEDIPFNTSEELEGFKIIVGKFPKVAFDHIVRHGQIRPNAESSRNKKYLNEVEFHYPNYWNLGLKNYKRQSDKNIIDNELALMSKNSLKPEDATKELSCRRLMLSIWQGWKQDANAWDNLFAVRGKGTGTQSITGMTVDNIKTLVNGK